MRPPKRTNPLLLNCPDKFRVRERNLSRLLNVVGLERFLELQDVLGGRRIAIPSRDKYWPCGVCSVRDRCIRGWHRQGHATKTIAGHLGVSPATVRRVLKTAVHPPALVQRPAKAAGPIEAV